MQGEKKKFMWQWTFHFFAYYMIEVTLTSSKTVLTFFLTFPVAHWKFFPDFQRKLIPDFSTTKMHVNDS